jgi:hypothetical protein
MYVLARLSRLTSRPPMVARFATPGQVFITEGERYQVFAVAVFEGHGMLQVVDDLRYPAWLPAWLFDVDDPSLPRDWICNAFREEPVLLLGPDFVAKDHEAYASMVELETGQVERFWKRFRSLEATDAGKD